MTTVSEIFRTMEYGPAPESDKQALEWIARHGGELGLFVGGRWAKPESGELLDVINPATTARLARVPQAGRGDVDAAVRAARAALLGGPRAARAGPLPVRARPRDPEARPPARRAREPRQRQIDPRDARPR